MVGNGVPVFDEVIISTQLMNKILHFDQFSGAVLMGGASQGGCVVYYGMTLMSRSFLFDESKGAFFVLY